MKTIFPDQLWMRCCLNHYFSGSPPLRRMPFGQYRNRELTDVPTVTLERVLARPWVSPRCKHGIYLALLQCGTIMSLVQEPTGDKIVWIRDGEMRGDEIMLASDKPEQEVLFVWDDNRRAKLQAAEDHLWSDDFCGDSKLSELYDESGAPRPDAPNRSPWKTVEEVKEWAKARGFYP
jgi:uncharacterized protein (DUF3820 family)